MENVGGSLGDFHPIGFSLGAQVAGNIGNRLSGKQIDRITGLDPAGELKKQGNHWGKLIILESSNRSFNFESDL